MLRHRSNEVQLVVHLPLGPVGESPITDDELLPRRLIRLRNIRNRSVTGTGKSSPSRGRQGNGSTADESRRPEKLTRYGGRSSAGSIASPNAADGERDPPREAGRPLVLAENEAGRDLQRGERKHRPYDGQGRRRSSWNSRLWHSGSPSSHAWASKPAEGGVTPTTTSRGIP
jgi:hypothetical protein